MSNILFIRPWLQRKSWKNTNNYKTWQNMWHFRRGLQRKSWKIIKNTKNHEKCANMTKILTFSTRIAAIETKVQMAWQLAASPQPRKPLNLNSLSPPLTAETLKSANARVLLSVCCWFPIQNPTSGGQTFTDLMDFYWFLLILIDINGFCLILIDFDWFWLFFIDFHWFSWILIDFDWFWMILIDFHRFS